MEVKSLHYREIRDESLRWGGELFGVAYLPPGNVILHHLPAEFPKKFSQGISIGIRLSDAVFDEIEDHPTPLYLHHYRQANYILDQIAFRVAALIQRLGGQALPIAASQIVDWEHQQGHLSHKALAQKAGLGWLGRNNLVVHPRFGGRIRLVSILTDLPLEVDKPLDNSCGTCRRCIVSCPAGAIKEAAEEFDHRGCFEKLKEFRSKYNIGQYICGVCVKACSPRG
jgi:epoxyqueuosine reductase